MPAFLISRFPHLRFLFSLVAFFAAAAAHAQTIRWEPLQGALAVGQTSELALIFEDCAPSETPRIPKVDGLTLEFAGQSTSTSIINFTRSDSVTFTYAARLTKKQRVTIPSFEIETNKGKLRTPAASYEPGSATVGNTGVSLENAANSRLVAAPSSVWVGEVFTLNYTLDAARSYFPDFGRGQIDWNAEPLVAEDWSRPEPLDFRAGSTSEPRTGLAYRTRAIARTPGAVRLNAVSQLLNLSVGVTGFGFFQQRQYQQYSVTSSAPVLEVKPLPAAPAGFNGAVGDLKLTSKIVPLTAAVGEPITWTLELTGPANWPDIPGLPARNVSKNFQVVSPQAKRTPAEGKLFDATLTEDVVLVPSKPGTYTLGPVNFTYFDPKAGAYKTVTTPAATVTITEAAAPTPAAGLNLNVTPASSEQSKIENPKSKVLPAPAPAALPRDPLPGSMIASLPLASRVVALWLALPVLALVLFWCWLALRRARETDPLLPRRAAYTRLQKILAELPVLQPSTSTFQPQQQSLLLRWQRDTALLLQIRAAAPTAADIPESKIENQQSKIQVLWSEAERTLYGENIPLPADWTTRALASLSSTPLPRFSPLRLFVPRNLFPFIAALTLTLFLAPTSLFAADATADYRKGDFVAAEKSYRATLATTPTDAIAHHNLSLALAQQDRWDEAAAHAAVALVQHPASEPIRAQFALAAEKSGHVPASLAVFLTPGPVHTLARMKSPANWQTTLIFAIAGLVISLGFILLHAYRRTTGPLAYGPYAALVFCALLALCAFIGWRAYGPVNDTRAAIAWRAGTLRSIPTEADTAQKTTPLAAGSLASVDQSFLGWRHLTFEAGQSGWVRAEDLVPVWK
jgi:tetratricopeptide (TPR) repeat protein